MYTLGIESSCDDSSIALYGKEEGLIFHQSFSHEKYLQSWGGVVPELAARQHAPKLHFLLKLTQDFLKKKFPDSEFSNCLAAIAVTTGPGLAGPLMVGLNIAKSLALLYSLPLIPINHLLAHMNAITLSSKKPVPLYPFVSLLVSGGNCLLGILSSPTSFHLMGQTLDDAPGETFDKIGKLLKLPYPAGKWINELAQTGNPEAYNFTIPLKNSSGSNFNFSFSGIKNQARILLEKNPDILLEENKKRNFCASLQQAINGHCLFVVKKFYEEKKLTLPLVVSGGVANNTHLRSLFKDFFVSQKRDVFFVDPLYCSDNAAMVASLGYTLLAYALPFPYNLCLDASSQVLFQTNILYDNTST